MNSGAPEQIDGFWRARPRIGAKRSSVTQGTTSQAVLEEFIKRHGDSRYGALARAQLEELKKSQVAVVAPPPKGSYR